MSIREVPQCSVLGPTLLNIFINDLAYAITQCRVINYSDETNIHCSDKNVGAVEANLNSDLENVTRWFIQNGMKPNPNKYQAMVLGRTEDQLLLNTLRPNSDLSQTSHCNILLTEVVGRNC